MCNDVGNKSANNELDILTDLFVSWWFEDWDDAHFFNEAVRQCPTLCNKISEYSQRED